MRFGVVAGQVLRDRPAMAKNSTARMNNVSCTSPEDTRRVQRVLLVPYRTPESRHSSVGHINSGRATPEEGAGPSSGARTLPIDAQVDKMIVGDDCLEHVDLFGGGVMWFSRIVLIFLSVVVPQAWGADPVPAMIAGASDLAESTDPSGLPSDWSLFAVKNPISKRFDHGGDDFLRNKSPMILADLSHPTDGRVELVGRRGR